MKALPRWTHDDQALRHLQRAMLTLIDARDYDTLKSLAKVAIKLQHRNDLRRVSHPYTERRKP